MWKAGLELMVMVDKLLAKAIARRQHEEATIEEGTDFHLYIVGLRLRGEGHDIPLPNLNCGPYQDRYFRLCVSLGNQELATLRF